MKREYHQACVGKHTLDSDPPDMSQIEQNEVSMIRKYYNHTLQTNPRLIETT